MISILNWLIWRWNWFFTFVLLTTNLFFRSRLLLINCFDWLFIFFKRLRIALIYLACNYWTHNRWCNSALIHFHLIFFILIFLIYITCFTINFLINRLNWKTFIQNFLLLRIVIIILIRKFIILIINIT
jgi:hypothetical protein